MAGTIKASFPTVPDAHWWALRKKFQQTIPGVVSANYVASVLAMKEDSARANVLPGLRLTKIIDDEGKPLDRAKSWRDDEQYPVVCAEIRREVYPRELLEAVPDPAADRAGATRWMANHTGAGEAAVTKMVRFYALLTEADPSKGLAGAGVRQSKNTKPGATAERLRKARPSASKVIDPKPEHPGHPPKEQSAGGPSVHINLQVHISADASPEQIDQMFASMAKHIYKKAAE